MSWFDDNGFASPDSGGFADEPRSPNVSDAPAYPNPDGTYSDTPYVAPVVGGNAVASGKPTLNIYDPASVDAYIAWMGQQPGVNPSVRNDPGYWRQQVMSGHLGRDEGYVSQRMFQPEGAPAGGGSLRGAFDTPPPAFVPAPVAGAAPYRDAPDVGRAPFTPYTAPAPFAYDKFEAPDPNKVKEDPAYQFRLKAGEDALQASASARGTLRTGGTLKDIAQWASDYATSEYDKIYGRAMDEWRSGFDVSKGTYDTNTSLGQFAANFNNTGAFNAFNADKDSAFTKWSGENAGLMNAFNANRAAEMDTYNANQSGSMANWAAQYGMSQDEINNLIKYAGIGSQAAAGAPPPVPTVASPYRPQDPNTGVAQPNTSLSGIYRPNGWMYA